MSEALERRSSTLTAAYDDTFNTDAGKMVFTDLMRQCGILECSFIPGDPHETAFNEGRRSIALHLIQQLRLTDAEMMEIARRRTQADIERARERIQQEQDP